MPLFPAVTLETVLTILIGAAGPANPIVERECDRSKMQKIEKFKCDLFRW
jgi:hypothetical protein